MKTRNLALTLSALALVAMTFAALPVLADHAWGNYHWERSANPVELTLGDNFDNPVWGSYYDTAVSDWDKSNVLSLTKVPGATRPRQCNPDTGNIEVCSDTYGNNGWLGLAGISVSGDHIVAAYAKMNDTYYCSGCTYDTPAWRALVMCQEIGHDFGLDHQDEDFDNPNLGTCMDYTSDPSDNQHPNQHDYQQLEDIYAHLDDGSGGGGCKGKNCAATGGQDVPPALLLLDLDSTGQWGDLIWRSEDGHQEMFELDFGNGFKRVTHVTYTQGFADLHSD